MLLFTATLLLTAMPTSTTPDPEEGIQKVLDDIYLGVSHQAKMDPDRTPNWKPSKNSPLAIARY